MPSEVAIVTGANKGIGYGIVKELCKRGVRFVYLTARDEARGKEAVNKLKNEGLNPEFYQLEVTDADSVIKFVDYLKAKHGGVDILINNAAICDKNFTKTTYEEAKEVINTNYKGNLTVQEYMFPILNDNARVINISSDFGHISHIKNQYWIDVLTKENITVNDINDFVNWFLESLKNGTFKEDDFTHKELQAYKVSKIALCALTRVQQNEVGRGISVNSIHPGFVQTDMTNNMGHLTVDEAAIAPVYLALDVDQSVKGRYFWFDKSEKDWTDSKLNFYDVSS